MPDADAVRKAEYLSEAYAQPSTAPHSTQYFLLRHAAAINPDDPYIAGALAEIEFLMPGVSEARREKELRRTAAPIFEPNPQTATTPTCSRAPH